MELNTVTISLDEYNELRDNNYDLEHANAQLQEALDELKDKPEQRVIYIETCTCEDEDGEENTCTDTSVKGFDEVKAEVEEFYKKKFADLGEQIEALNGTIESQKQTADALSKKALEAEMEVSRLKHRNLWQRILNK